MKHQQGAPTQDHPSSEPSDGLAPGRRQRVPPLDYKRVANGNRRLSPLPKELQLVAEIDQVSGPIPVHLINDSDEVVMVSGYEAEVQGDRSGNDFNIGHVAGVVDPGGALAFPVSFEPKEERPEDQEHTTARETSLAIMDHGEKVAKMRLRGSARPSKGRARKAPKAPRGASVETPKTVDEIESYVREAVDVMGTDRERAIELAAAANRRLDEVADQALVRERFAGYGLGLETAMQSIGSAKTSTRSLERHLRSGASVSGGYHVRALGQAREPLQLMTGEIAEAKTIRTMHEASPISDAVETVVDVATDATFAAGFGVGAVKGVYESVIQMCEAIGATLELVLEIAKAMLADGLLGVLVTIGKKLGDFFSSMPGAARAIDAMFEKDWDNPSGWDRGMFRGQVVGYVVAQAILAMVTGGAIVIAGKWAVVGRLLKTVDAAGDITAYAAGAANMVSKIEQAGGNVIQGPWKAMANAAEDLGKDASKAEREAAGVIPIDRPKPKEGEPGWKVHRIGVDPPMTLKGYKPIERPPELEFPRRPFEPDEQTRILHEHGEMDGFRVEWGLREVREHDTPMSRVAPVGEFRADRVEEMLRVGRQTPSVPNTLVVVMHHGHHEVFHVFRPTELRKPEMKGSPSIDIMELDHRRLYMLLSRQGKLKDIENIILVNWGSGVVDNGVAQWLANKSKRNVYAPNQSTWEQRYGATTWTKFDPKTRSHRQHPVRRKQTGDATTNDVQETANAGIERSGSTLPFLSQIQASFGRHDVSGVQAHLGGEAAEACGELGAEAYATGNHVAFGGAPSLHTAAHEAAHVVQQRSGVYLKDGLGDSGDIYEEQADAAADAVVEGRSAEEHLDAIDKVPAVANALRKMGENSDPIRDLIMSLLPSELSRNLLGRYMDGTGEPYVLSHEEMIACHAGMSLRVCEPFMAQVGLLKEAGGGTQSVPYVKSLGVAASPATLGNFRVEWRGAVTVTGEAWQFTGSVQFYDVYDFDAHDDGSRPHWAELKTRLAGKVIAGKPFEIHSTPIAAWQTHEDVLAQWVGYTDGSEDAPDAFMDRLRPPAARGYRPQQPAGDK